MESNDILVTGANSGFGKHCCEFFNAVGYTRSTSFSEILAQAKQKPFRAIIHSAFNAKPSIAVDRLYDYLNDTLFLTKQLLTIPHEKFIFISTVDVYPKSSNYHHEDEEIDMSKVVNLYGMSKLMSEAVVKSEAKNYLILRPTAMLGMYAKPNSLMKILQNTKPKLTLTGDSVFNYIRHNDLSAFITKALEQDLTGIYNTASSSNITLQEAAAHFGREAEFGEYHYHTDNINNEKATKVLTNFSNTSLQNIQLFLDEAGDYQAGKYIRGK